MFDTLDDQALLSAMSAAQSAERVAAARRVLLAGRLVVRRMAGVEEDDRSQWCIDNWEAVAAEIGAELGISRGRASTQMNYGFELLERLPKLGAAFAAGRIELRVIAAALFRTALITDPEILSRLDTALAANAGSWNTLSRKRLVEVIDRWVAEFDLAALRRSSSAAEDRHIEFGEAHYGMVEFWGSLRAPDAAALERTIEATAGAVCSTDPRTKQQRRADALIALAGASSARGCECGAADCPAAHNTKPAQVVIHVIAEAATLAGEGTTPALLPGYGALPADMLAGLADRARLRPLTPPHLLVGENRYRPSAALAEFIRCRDLNCRFPGCDKPAEVCDIDHTVPWQAGGPTHPSNLALLCRAHHLLKTFWTGRNGWAEKQSPDGTIVWTSPTGRRYTTTPGGALFFPQLAHPTGELILDERPANPRTGRTLMMPTRRRTRAAERAARIRWERALNEARSDAEPPPF